MVKERNQAISDWLAEHREAIQMGEVVVYAVDECHLKGGDICGYGWGKRGQRRDIEIDNYRDSQTYFGALDCFNGELVVRAAYQGNSATTISFLQQLQQGNPNTRIAIIWDGASYHRSAQLQAFLSEVNGQEDWQIHCLRLPPYAPEQNPIENVWGQAKQVLRKMHQQCCSFKLCKGLFQLLFEYQLLTIPDLSTYDAFSVII